MIRESSVISAVPLNSAVYPAIVLSAALRSRPEQRIHSSVVMMPCNARIQFTASFAVARWFVGVSGGPKT